MIQDHSSSSEAVCRDIVNCVSEALIFADTEGVIQIWNPGAEAVFGYSQSESVGQSLDLIIPERLRNAHWSGFRRAVSEGATVHGRRSMVTRSLHKNGHAIYVDMSFAIVKNEAGEVIGSVAIARDVTQQKLAEKNQKPAHA